MSEREESMEQGIGKGTDGKGKKSPVFWGFCRVFFVFVFSFSAPSRAPSVGFFFSSRVLLFLCCSPSVSPSFPPAAHFQHTMVSKVMNSAGLLGTSSELLILNPNVEFGLL